MNRVALCLGASITSPRSRPFFLSYSQLDNMRARDTNGRSALNRGRKNGNARLVEDGRSRHPTQVESRGTSNINC